MILVNLFERPASRLLFLAGILWVHSFRWSWVHEAKIPTSLKHPCTSWSKQFYPWSPWKSFQTHNLSISFPSTKMPYTWKPRFTVGISANQRHDKLHLKSRKCLVDRQSSPCFYQLPAELGVVFLSLTLSEKKICFSNLDPDHVLQASFGRKNVQNGLRFHHLGVVIYRGMHWRLYSGYQLVRSFGQ